MLRECIVCRKVIGEIGNLKNHDITGSICPKCQSMLDSMYYCNKQYRKTGKAKWLKVASKFRLKLKERERNGRIKENNSNNRKPDR